MYPHVPAAVAAQPDPGLVRAVKTLAVAGLALVLLFPAARGHGYWFGWAPLWLVGMPLAAWWALHRFRLPRRVGRSGTGLLPAKPRWARFHAQARRCGRPSQRWPQARVA